MVLHFIEIGNDLKNLFSNQLQNNLRIEILSESPKPVKELFLTGLFTFLHRWSRVLLNINDILTKTVKKIEVVGHQSSIVQT